MKKALFTLGIIASAIVSGNRCSAQVIISSVAGNGVAGYMGDGTLASGAEVFFPFNVAIWRDGSDVNFDASGNMIFSDQQNNVIRSVNSSGIISTVIGDNTATALGDGGPASAAGLNAPAGIAVDASGNIYICDYNNSLIRKVTHATNIISSIAGNGTAGYSGDGAAANAAAIGTPAGITLDAAGNIYFSDHSNNVVRKITIATGIISTVAGGGTIVADGGPATACALSQPQALLVDAAGNIYIADYGNNEVRKVDHTTGIISAFAGNGSTTATTDGVVATSTAVAAPRGLTYDSKGNMYISSGTNYIRKVNTSNIIYTIAGTGAATFSGDGGSPALAALNYPSRIRINGLGDMYIIDDANMRVRKISLHLSLEANTATAQRRCLQALPNPSNGNFILTVNSPAMEPVKVTFTDMTGRKVKELEINSNQATEVSLTLAPGVYEVNACTAKEAFTEKVVIAR
jgi:trimeric autotransporter adhesin